MTPGRRSLLLMAAFVGLWAVVELLAAGVLSRYSPYQVVWMRYATHIAFMLLLWGWRDPSSLWRTRRPAYQLGRSLLMLGMPASWVIAMRQGVDVETLMAIFWLSPLLILGLAAFMLGERAPWPVWAAGGLACVAAQLVLGHGSLPPLRALVFPVGMALTFSLYVAMTRSLRFESLRANLFYTAFGVLLALTPALPGLWITPTAHDAVVMVLVGLLGFGALLALDRSAAAAPVSLAAPVSSLQLVFMTGGGWLLGHAPGGGRAVVGMLAIVAIAAVLWALEPRWRVERAWAGEPGVAPRAAG